MMIEVRPCSSRSSARLDQELGRAVDVRGGLVEDQDARVGEQRAGDGDELALARREARAALAHAVVEALREARGDAVDADRLGRAAHLARRWRRAAAKRMLSAMRAGEQEGILQHDAELAAVAAQLNVAQVDAVGAHGAVAAGRRSAR